LSVKLFGADATDVPLPSQRNWVEREQPFFGQSGEELNREERIAAALLLHQLHQGPGVLWPAMQSIGHEPADILEGKGAHHYFLDRRSGTANRLEHSQKWVRGFDLVVSIGPDQQQMPHLRVGDQVLEEVQRRWIQPLQIVEEQHERMLLP